MPRLTSTTSRAIHGLPSVVTSVAAPKPTSAPARREKASTANAIANAAAAWSLGNDGSVAQPGGEGANGRSSSTPGRTIPTWASGASFQAPGRSPSGSETTTRVSSDSDASSALSG